MLGFAFYFIHFTVYIAHAKGKRVVGLETLSWEDNYWYIGFIQISLSDFLFPTFNTD